MTGGGIGWNGGDGMAASLASRGRETGRPGHLTKDGSAGEPPDRWPGSAMRSAGPVACASTDRAWSAGRRPPSGPRTPLIIRPWSRIRHRAGRPSRAAEVSVRWSDCPCAHFFSRATRRDRSSTGRRSARKERQSWAEAAIAATALPHSGEQSRAIGRSRPWSMPAAPNRWAYASSRGTFFRIGAADGSKSASWGT